VAVPGPDHVYWQHMQTALSHCQHCGPVHVHYTVLCGLSRLLSSCGLQCRTAQSEAEKLRSQVEKLQHENRMLRMRLGEDAPKQEPVTPRMYSSLPTSSVCAQDSHLDLFCLSLVHMIRRHVLPQYSCVAS